MSLRIPERPPTLTDGVVTLAQFSVDDLDQLVLNCQDPVTVQWTTVPVPYTAEDARWYALEYAPAAWADRTALVWAVRGVEGRLLGTIELARVRGTTADIGINFGPHARGTGAAEAAARILVRYAFNELGFTHLHWVAFDGNWASVKLAWKLGFGAPVFIGGLHEQRGHSVDCWVSTRRCGDSAEPAYQWCVPVRR